MIRQFFPPYDWMNFSGKQIDILIKHCGFTDETVRNLSYDEGKDLIDSKFNEWKTPKKPIDRVTSKQIIFLAKHCNMTPEDALKTDPKTARTLINDMVNKWNEWNEGKEKKFDARNNEK